jgi:hypothetical protein
VGFFLAKVCRYISSSFYLLVLAFLQWLGRQSYLDDLSSLDPDLYNRLIFLKHYTGSVEELSSNSAMVV